MTLPQATVSTEPVPAAELIVEVVSRSTQPVVVFVSGSHTNLAEALRLEPGIADRIRGVYIMGGEPLSTGQHQERLARDRQQDSRMEHLGRSGGRPGGVRLRPAAAPDPARRHQPGDLDGWAASGSAEGTWARDLLEWTLNAWSASEMYIWDLVAAVSATDPALCPEAPLAVEVVVAAGPEQGRTVVVEGAPNVGVCLEPDAAQIKARAAGILGR